MNILQVRAAPGGCREYRMNIPARALSELGHVVTQVDSGVNLKVSNQMLAGYDCIILQKVQDTGWFRIINSIPKEYRPVSIYEVDDLLWDIPTHNPAYHEWNPVSLQVLECIHFADAVTCSTKALASEIRRIVNNKTIKVIPNYLDLNGRNWKESKVEKSNGVNIGWAGGEHHYRDNEPMMEGLRSALVKRPFARFVFMGNAELCRLWYNDLDLPNQFYVTSGTSFDDYPESLSLFDIGVAPLLTNTFNRCKGDLKCLEYNAWGIPYVASDIEPYSRYNYDALGGGYLASSNKEWERMLLHLIDNREGIKEIGARGRRYVWNHRGPKQCGLAWEKALTKILEKHNAIACK